MNNKFRDAFEPICATEELKEHLNTFVGSELSKRQRKTLVPLRVAVACCAMLVVCGIIGYNFYQTPVSYISIDVNPSLELALNRLDRVVNVTAYNDDGAQILQNLNLINKPYTQAVESLLANEPFEDYLSEDSLLSFTVVSKKEETLLLGIQQCNGYAENRATCHGAKAELIDEAHSNGLSFGKYQAYLALAKYDKSITPEDCRKLSMRQIRDCIDQYAEGQGTEQTPGENASNQGNGKGHGNGHHGDKHHKNKN